MRGIVNDGGRWLIARGLTMAGLVFGARHQAILRGATSRQERLRQRYAITADTPIVTWSDDLSQALRRHSPAAAHAPVAVTAGSAGDPKQVPYEPRRLRAVRVAFVDMFARACRAYGIRRRSLYVFGGVAAADASLTSLLLQEPRPVPYLATLQAPYRVHATPPMRALATRYGDSAVRLWVLALANPGVLYSTNPSTLVVFLEDVERDWRRTVRLVRDYVGAPWSLPAGVTAIAGRLQSVGAATRLGRLASSPTPVPLATIAPAVEAYFCWTGGDVQPFLDRLDRRLPPDRYRRIPMFSMATESIETTAAFEPDGIAFVPAARGVCYEFLDAATPASAPLRPADLVPGRRYGMIVSDAYGLRRYDTGDVFLCRGLVRGLPDLAFEHRRDLSYSFTGEKVSARQVSAVFSLLRRDRVLQAGDVVACVPSHPIDDAMPHYKLLCALVTEDTDARAVDAIAETADRQLAGLNLEYRAKRESRRIGPMRAIRMRLSDLVAVAARHGMARPDTQFKLPPLIRRRWEELQDAADAGPARVS